MKTFSLIILLALAGFQTRAAHAFGVGYQIGQESVTMAERRVGGASDLAYQSLSYKFTTQRIMLLDISKTLATGFSSDYDLTKYYWTPAVVMPAAKDTRWLNGSTSISYIMGSSTDAEQVLVAGGPTVKPASTNSFWGVDVDLCFAEYQFLKAPLDVSFSYDAQFRSYTIANVYDGSTAKTGQIDGMMVNGYLSIGAELGVFPNVTVWGRAGYDPLMSAVSVLYADLISPGAQIDAGAEWQPLRFLSVFATMHQQTTGFFGVSRPTTITDTEFGARVFFF